MSASALDVKPKVTAERQEFYGRLSQKSAAPLWEVLSDIVTVKPKPVGVPALWRYDELRPLLMEAGGLITAQEAGARVLILENPALQGKSQITGTLYAGLQLVLPGELAPSHRHTPSALRFVLESEGGYTAVDGERIKMLPGDFIVTPSWTYHDHGNDSKSPIVWMDVLDLPLINYLAVGFAEHHPQETQPVTKQPGDSLARFGDGLFPVNFKPTSSDSPVHVYPYDRSKAALLQAAKSTEAHRSHGFKNALFESGHRRVAHRHDRHVPANAAREVFWRAVSFHRRDHLLREGRARQNENRRHDILLGPPRYLRRTVVDARTARSVRTGHRLQRVRSPCAASTGTLARRRIRLAAHPEQRSPCPERLCFTVNCMTLTLAQQAAGRAPGMLLVAALATGVPLWSQDALPAGRTAGEAPALVPAVTPEREVAVAKTGAGGVVCLEPAPMVRWQDYNGPFAKIVGTLGEKVDRPSIRQPNFKEGDVLCSLNVKDKFLLFVHDTTNPFTVLTVAFNSGIDQAENAERRFGQGMEGFGKRLGANEASDATGRFFSEFAFPTLLREDPRYYRLGDGTIKHRLGHALEHTLVAHHDNGSPMPNISLWAGTTAGVLMSDVYHPGTTHGPGPISRQVGLNIAEDAAYDILREFWPEIAKAFHVPFRSSEPNMRPSD